MKCPNCGAEIGTGRTCEFCGTEITLDMLKTQEQLNKTGCPNCHSTNIQFRRENQGEIRGKKSKKIVHKTVGFCKDCGYTWVPSGNGQQNSPKSRLWLWVLGWICIFPLPLTILLLRKKDMKPAVKYGIIAAAWILFILMGATGNKSDSSNKSSNYSEITTATVVEESVVENGTEETIKSESVASDDTEEIEKLTFLITPNEKGKYGFENTLNEGTEFEETQIVYHIPAGTYSVTNLGEYSGQIEACSDKTHITEEGWQEPEEVGQIVVIDSNETVEFTIEDGFYLEIHINGDLVFVQK